MSVFEHFLDFGIDSFGLIQISEPVKFDAFAFTVKQGEKRFGRDKIIGADTIELEFWNRSFEPISTPRIGMSGEIIEYLNHCFDEILEVTRADRKGFEAEIKYILNLDGVEFITGLLDISNMKTDEITKLSCNIIQNTNQAIIDRVADTTADVFSNVNLNGNPMVPLQTTRFLLKGKPSYEVSMFSNNENTAGGIATVQAIFPIPPGETSPGTRSILGANNINVVLEDGVTNTLGYISNEFPLILTSSGQWMPDGGLNFTYLFADNEKTDVNIIISNLVAYSNQSIVDSIENAVITGSGYARLVVHVGIEFNDPNMETYVLWERDFGFVHNSPTEYLPTSFTLNIPKITRGKRMYIFLQPYAEATFEATGSAEYVVGAVMLSGQITINTSSSAIDTVIDAVKYPEYLKKGIESISGLPLDCPVFESGGKFGDMFTFNGNMLRSRKGLPLNFVFNNEFTDDIRFLCLDYEISDDKVEILPYADFYPNVDLGSFEVDAAATIELFKNKRFQIITADIKFETYETNKDAKNTIDSFNTESQYKLPNNQIQDKIELSVKTIFDAFQISDDQILAARETTALDTDNKIYRMDAVQLAPGTQATQNAVLTQSLSLSLDNDNSGHVYLLNKAVTGDDVEDASFKWTQLGISVGDTFDYDFSTFTNLTNIVFAITDTILTLQPVGYTATFAGTAVFTFRYFYTNVLWTNRTFQGFDLIENLQSGNNCSNLKYTIRRTQEEWGSYYNTICSAYPTGQIRNTLFINNGALTTQFMGGAILVENGNIDIDTLPDKILTENAYSPKIKTDFVSSTNLIKSRFRGFIRIKSAKGEIKKIHIAESKTLFVDELMDITMGEVRADPEVVTITKTSGIIYINEAGYSPEQLNVVGWFEVSAFGLCQIFDEKYFGIINPTLFSEISVDGVFYTDKQLFVQKMLSIQY